MIAISASSLSLSFGDTVILRDITFAAQDGEHIGIVGTNGAGKTSLFRLLSGEYTPDAGTVSLRKGYTVGVLEQNADLTALPGNMTMEQYMITAFPALLALENRIPKFERVSLPVFGRAVFFVDDLDEVSPRRNRRRRTGIFAGFRQVEFNLHRYPFAIPA